LRRLEEGRRERGRKRERKRERRGCCLRLVTHSQYKRAIYAIPMLAIDWD